MLIGWTKDNYMKANADNFLVLLSDTNENLTLKVENITISNRGKEKLLGIIIDGNLSFDEHVWKLCKTARQRLHALSRTSLYMDFSMPKMITNAFVNSQFNHCPLVRMCHSRELNHRISKIQEKSLRITFQDEKYTFSKLLEKNGSVIVHEKDLQTLESQQMSTINPSAEKWQKQSKNNSYHHPAFAPKTHPLDI